MTTDLPVKGIRKAQPPSDAPPEVTDLLARYQAGDDAAFAALVPLVETEMHRLARRYLSQSRPGHTLQPTALVNEAFLVLMGQRHKEWEGKAHFLAVAALAMRQVLTQYARKRLAQKRGGGEIRVTLDDSAARSESEGVEILELDRALEELALENERQARIVDLRYFGGMSIEQVAEVMKVSPRTVKREWTAARAWLFGKLQDRDSAKP